MGWFQSNDDGAEVEISAQQAQQVISFAQDDGLEYVESATYSAGAADITYTDGAHTKLEKR